MNALTCGLGLAIALLLSTESAVLAQAVGGSQTADMPPNNGAGQDLGEIVVTAQKRSQSVNTVSLSVTALGEDQLKSSGVVAIANLTSVVPDLQIRTVGVDSFVGISIRGISNQNFDLTSNAAVSTYIDGIYVDLPVGFAAALYDLDRLEVLRGPQGTLYGRSATGGSLNVVTATPTQRFETSGDLSYGNYNDVQAHAVVNLKFLGGATDILR